MEFLNRYTPNFIWKNQNALMDYGLIIEQELPYIVPKRKYEEIPILGSNRILHEWFEDYEPFDLEIPNISVSYDKLPEVKRWLVGESKLITHNDPDKFCYAICNMSSEQRYQNEWGVFYSFSITFRCDPLKYKVNDPDIALNKGKNIVVNDGDEKSAPFFILESNGGDITIECNEYKLTLLNTKVGTITIDTELAMCVQNEKRQRTKGNWLRLKPGKQFITISGNTSGGKMRMKGVFL